MVTTAFHGTLLALAAVDASAAASGGAAGHRLPGEVSLFAAVGAGVSYDDNALLGRRGQFLDSQVAGRTGGGREADVATRQLVMLGLARRFGRRDEVSLEARAELSRLRTVSELRGYDVSSNVAYSWAPVDHVRIEPSGRVIYHREQAEWSYRSVRPRMSAGWLLASGLAAESTYQFTRQQFARLAAGEPQLKQSYANIDARSHAASLGLRRWFGPRVRPDLVAGFEAASYDGNLNGNLADYAGLAPGTERRDLGGGVTAAVLVLPARRLILAPGGRVEVNVSNSNPYSFRAAHALAGALWEPWDGHALYAQVDLSRFDFPHERFDRRYLNTRIDYRRDIKIAYRYQATDGLRAELLYGRMDSTSNDCMDFDPRRDELGLPVFSRSYSCFDQNRVAFLLTYDL